MLLPVILIASLAALDAAPPKGVEMTGPVGIIDGDTIRLDQRKIRFHGMDAPEIGSTCPGVEGDCGRAATRQLAALIKGADIRCVSEGYMSYDRVVAVCYAIQGDQREDLGGLMVAQGWAEAAPHFSDRYVCDEKAARYFKAGMWRNE